MKYLLIGFIALLSFDSQAQGTAYLLKGGLTFANQQWNNFQRDPLFTWHGAVAIESLSESDQFSLFAQLGYHNKGSAIRYGNQLFRDLNNNFFNPPNDKFFFRNASLVLGGKRRFFTDVGRAYLQMGLRLDYTLKTNLDEYEIINERLNTLFYPQDNFVQKWNYGFTFGGGFEFELSEFVMPFIEINLNPDVSRQYFQPPVPNVYDPQTGQSRSFGERSIRNFTLELSVGIRLLRKVEYID